MSEDLVIVYEDDTGVHVIKPNNDWLICYTYC
jgi:hypothetical protein